MTSFKNIPASVRQRLLNLARKDKRPFNELIQYYAMEPFLYSLSRFTTGFTMNIMLDAKVISHFKTMSG
ncbi:MAG: hypothetical protein WC799_20575 [Desulfobacteraceae bacterium]|jgi:hypothetical protein